MTDAPRDIILSGTAAAGTGAGAGAGTGTCRADTPPDDESAVSGVTVSAVPPGSTVIPRGSAEATAAASGSHVSANSTCEACAHALELTDGEEKDVPEHCVDAVLRLIQITAFVAQSTRVCEKARRATMPHVEYFSAVDSKLG